MDILCTVSVISVLIMYRGYTMCTMSYTVTMDILHVLVIYCVMYCGYNIVDILCVLVIYCVMYCDILCTVSVISVLIMYRGYTMCTMSYTVTMDILHVLVIYCVMYCGYNIVDILCVLVIYCVMYCVMIYIIE